jgi:Spy/CpxP family protein refolding chaperone
MTLMKKLFTTLMTLGLATALMAAPQATQTSPSGAPEQKQEKSGKPGKRHGGKHEKHEHKTGTPEAASQKPKN